MWLYIQLRLNSSCASGVRQRRRNGAHAHAAELSEVCQPREAGVEIGAVVALLGVKSAQPRSRR